MISSASPSIRVLITHERFLFRYGADRVFILIAEQLRSLGCHVTMLAARFDRSRLSVCANQIVTLPLPENYARCDEFCSRWFRTTFMPEAEAQGGYDLIIHGGWPLFGATESMLQLAPRVMFLDHGVVPNRGYPAKTQKVLEHLRALRREHLSACTHAAGVSRFIVETQTLPDVGLKVPVRVLLNGTDHLPQVATVHNEPSAQRVRALANSGHPLILTLGRFEWGTYKNSQAALEIFQTIRSAIPAARLLVLEESENLRLPEDLGSGVVHLGYPSDSTLSEIIAAITLGISPSLWEGYNLPVVELLRLGVPALALKVGAHAEIMPHPWFLCANEAQISAKAISIIQDPRKYRKLLTSSDSASHWASLTWARFVHQLITFVDLRLPRQSIIS